MSSFSTSLLEDTPGNPASDAHDGVPKGTTMHETRSSIIEPRQGTGTESESESDVEIRRPLGRAARRMLGAQQKIASSPPQISRSSPVNLSIEQVDTDEDELYSVTPMRARKRVKHDSPSPPASETRSTLFVSPAKSFQEADQDDLPRPKYDSKARLAALVAEKRAERLEREAAKGNGDDDNSDHISSDLPDEILEDSQAPVNEDIERIMSDAVRPTRKASKRAILEMERETQRLARQQALAHQMKVRKKFTTTDLFAKFNFRPSREVNAPAENSNSASSAPNSDAVEREPVSTPPSSPPTPLDRQRALVEQGALSKMVPVREDSLTSLTTLDDQDRDHTLPETVNTLSTAQAASPMHRQPAQADPAPKRGLKLARLGKEIMATHSDDSSGDELEIIKDQPSYLRIFEKAKGTMKREQTDSKAIHTLKHLAHLGADNSHTGRRKKGNPRPSVNPQVLEAQLRMRAKDQARAQQLERIAELKAKGIDVQTTEEREREQEAFESLLEKARQEAVELRKAEKAAAKGLNIDGNADASDDESEDEDYVDISGSDDEVDKASAEKAAPDMIDDMAEDDEDDEREQEAETEDEGEVSGTDIDVVAEEAAPPAIDQPAEASSMAEAPLLGRGPRKSHVVVDDDDSDMETSPQSSPGLAQDEEEDEDPFAAFNIGAAAGNALMSPTQAFHATMQTPTQATQQESLDFLRYLVPPSSTSLPSISPMLQAQLQIDSQVDVVPGSQVSESQQINLAWETQAPETPVPGGKIVTSDLTHDTTPGWQPTQDDGLPAHYQRTPTLRRTETLETIDEQQTQSTVRLRISESPASMPAERKRLVRGQRALVESSDEDDVTIASDRPNKRDAFREMARKRREALTAAELAETEKEAKAMMDEQAEESEDEYAGLGGDDFVAPETEQDREMIDSSLIDVNEQELAALYAERQRAADEAAASKLYKDLTTGALRRKQANAFDLEEDEDDLAVRRRQMKQREEARKRKLLLQDDNIAGLAEGKQSKGKDAFLKAIADDDERDEEVLDLSEAEEDDVPATQEDSQPSQQAASQPEPLREVSGNKRRPEESPEDRPPAKQRRTKPSAFRAPTSLLEVKESVSFLLDEPHAVDIGPSMLDFSSDSENDAQDQDAIDEASGNDDETQAELSRQNDGGFAPDQVSMPPPRLPASQRRTPAVVDRLQLKRGNSASENTAGGRTAWSSTSNSAGFKVPSLLRRATTNTAFAANERGVTTSNGLSRENSGSSHGSGVKMGGTKKSSLAYQARAEERKAIVEGYAKRRAENTARIALLRRAASSGFGKGLGGSFE